MQAVIGELIDLGVIEGVQRAQPDLIQSQDVVQGLLRILFLHHRIHVCSLVVSWIDFTVNWQI